jgi:hypothetical protein
LQVVNTIQNACGERGVRTDRRNRRLDVALETLEGVNDLRVGGCGALNRVGDYNAEKGNEEEDREGRELGELHRGKKGRWGMG